MKFKHTIYTFLTIAFTFLTGCSDDVVVPDVPGNGTTADTIVGDYELQFVISLDNMGGAVSSRAGNPMQDIENYIDVERIRIMFFTCVEANGANDYDHDYFLFEPKNHWVKKISTEGSDNAWLVSIPMFTHGNNTPGFEWNWGLIRERLTSAPFKIAILANRPEFDYAGELSDNPTSGYMDNKGPYWTSADAYDGVEANMGNWKDVFDLQHCQFDFMYNNKSAGSENYAPMQGYYGFILGDGVTMGATASWLDWSRTNTKGFENSSSTPTQAKCFRHPSYDYPIPMYGIQQFDAIGKDNSTGKDLWLEGSPFYLSPGIPGQEVMSNYDQKMISLLRSVVKTELLIPKDGYTDDDLEMVSMCYPNVYSRCDPMDVWTPTNELWKDSHPTLTTSYAELADCEISSLLNFGPVSRSTDNYGSSVNDYQQRLSWFYGAWLEKGWNFNTLGRNNVTKEETSTPYPRIFNPIIQRNQLVICEENICFDDVPGYWHYVVYCGERNINDPSNLNNLGCKNSSNTSVSSGNATTQYWMIQLKGYCYAIPITDYSAGSPVLNLTAIKVEDNYTTTNNGATITPKYKTLADGTKYLYNHQAASKEDAANKSWYTLNDNFMEDNMTVPTNQRSWPLIRNHVYTITLSKKTNSRGKDSGFSVKCEDSFSPKI